MRERYIRKKGFCVSSSSSSFDFTATVYIKRKKERERLTNGNGFLCHSQLSIFSSSFSFLTFVGHSSSFSLYKTSLFPCFSLHPFLSLSLSWLFVGKPFLVFSNTTIQYHYSSPFTNSSDPFCFLSLNPQWLLQFLFALFFFFYL